MKRLAWLTGTALVVLLIAGGVLLLVGNLFVQSAAMQAKIRRELSLHLKMPAEIRKTTLTPWDGLRIDGVTAPAGNPPASGETGTAVEPDAAASLLRLIARSFRARLAFGPLLKRHEIVVREILFDTPELTWVQTPDGRWRWPRGDALRQAAAREKQRTAELAEGRTSSAASPAPPEPAASAGPSPAAAAGSSPASEANASSSEAPARPAGTPRVAAAPGGLALATAPINVAIKGFRVRHGTAHFLDTRSEPYGHFENINLDGQVAASGAAAQGQLWFGRSVLRDLPTLTKFESAFSYTAESLDITEGHGDLAGGVARVEYHLRHADAGSPFQLRGRVEKVALDQLSKEIPPAAPRFLSGQLDGEVEMGGLSNSTASRTGRGQLRLVDAQLQNLPLLQTLGDYLHIPELSQLKLKSAQLDCRLEGETLRIDPLVLVTGSLRMEARGTCGLTGDQPLALQARLIIDRATSRGLSQFVEDIFTAVENSTDGARYIDFNITGSLANPHTDLLDRAVKSARPLQDLLQTYIGGSKKGKGSGASGGNSSGNNNSGRRGAANTSNPNPTPAPPAGGSAAPAKASPAPSASGSRPGAGGQGRGSSN